MAPVDVDPAGGRPGVEPDRLARLAILANQVSAEGSDRMGTYTAP